MYFTFYYYLIVIYIVFFCKYGINKINNTCRKISSKYCLLIKINININFPKIIEILYKKWLITKCLNYCWKTWLKNCFLKNVNKNGNKKKKTSKSVKIVLYNKSVIVFWLLRRIKQIKKSNRLKNSLNSCMSIKLNS